jgi:hypothetical protein
MSLYHSAHFLASGFCKNDTIISILAAKQQRCLQIQNKISSKKPKNIEIVS